MEVSTGENRNGNHSWSRNMNEREDSEGAR